MLWFTMVFLLLHLLPFVVGLVTALVSWQRHPAASLLAALGCGVGVVLVSLPLVGPFTWPPRFLVGNAWRELDVMFLLYPVVTALIIAAVFVGRGPVRPAFVPLAEEVPPAPRGRDTGIRSSDPAESLTPSPRR